MANYDEHVRPTNLHRVFIQSMLSRRIVTVSIALELYKRAIAACREYDEDFAPRYNSDKAGLASFVNDVSGILHSVSMEVVYAHDQKDGRQFLVLRNQVETDVAKIATDYSPAEVEYYRLVVEAIVMQYPKNSIAHGQALNLVSEVTGQTKMAKSVAEAVLTSLVSRGWLDKSPMRDRYSLGLRAISELETYLKSEFPEIIRNCARCKRAVWKGLICPDDECDAHYHVYCHKILADMPSRKGACVGCKVSLSTLGEFKHLGEDAASRMEDDHRGGLNKRKRGKGKGKGRASRANEDEDDDESDDQDQPELEEEEEEGVFSGTARKLFVPETQFDD
ncbi:hypothetical protein IAT38_001025 [Cryptococcus sp. DSM 104549]